jgi:DNA-binding CsgD family transcriptional regulator
LLIEGEPGVGKSTLLSAASGQAKDFRTLRVRGVESESGFGNAGLLELLLPVVDDLESLPKGMRAALAGALGLEAAIADSFRVAAAVATFFTHLAKKSPLLIIADDMQWVDAPTARSIAFAARRLHDGRIAFVMALRAGTVPTTTLDGIEHMSLRPLDGATARALVDQYGVEGARALEIVAAAGGNPLSLVELARWEHEGQGPWGTVAERLFGARVSELDTDAEEALLGVALSISGDESTLAKAVGLAPMRELQTLGLVQGAVSHVELRHPLMRELVLARASADAKRGVHEALAWACPPGAERTRHRALATLGFDAGLADELESLAKRGGGRKDSVWALSQAAALTPPGRRRSVRLAVAAHAAFESRSMHETHRLVAELEATRDRDALVEAAVLNGRILIADGALTEGAGMMRTAADDLAEAEPARAARLLIECATAFTDADQVNLARGLIARARELTRGDDPVLRLLIEAAHAEAEWVGGRFLGASRAYRDAAEHADCERLVHQDRAASMRLAEALHSGGLHERAREVTTSLVQRSRREGALGELRFGLSILFSVEHATSNVGAASLAATEELAIATDLGLLRERKEALGHVAWCDAYAGRADECRSHARERMELSARTGQSAVLHCAVGILELGLGNAEAAAKVFDAALRDEERIGWPLASAFNPVAPELIESLARCGREAEAVAALDVFALEARALQRPLALALASRCRGLLVDVDEFDTEFGRALEHELGEPRPFERARTLLYWGERSRRAGRRSAAKEHFYAAFEQFSSMGADLWAHRAEAELVAMGERVSGGAMDRPRTALQRATALTRQEVVVSALVSEGLTNREVASRLFVSTNTVETHLRHIFAKLGVRSRTELSRKITDFRDVTNERPP